MTSRRKPHGAAAPRRPAGVGARLVPIYGRIGDRKVRLGTTTLQDRDAAMDRILATMPAVEAAWADPGRAA